ncbi:unnamed protein product, partial [Prorocentrum cordatum]
DASSTTPDSSGTTESDKELHGGAAQGAAGAQGPRSASRSAVRRRLLADQDLPRARRLARGACPLLAAGPEHRAAGGPAAQ